MRLIKNILIYLLITFGFIYGTTFKSKGDLTMFLDSYQYQGPDNCTLIELSYSIDLSYLNYIDFEGQNDNMQIAIIVESTNGSTILNKSFAIDEAVIKNTELNYIGFQSFSTSYDTVKINLFFKDSFIDRQCQIQGLLPIKKYDSSSSLSDIMFVKNIDKSKSNSIFSKGGLNLIPLSNRTINIGSDKKAFYVYYQINNIFFSDKNESWYLPRYEIIGLDGTVFINSKLDSVLKTSSNSSRIEVIKVNDLKVGKYTLNIIIEDLTTGDILSTKRSFTISEKSIGKNQMLPMEKSDIKKYLNQIKYIATYEEKKLFKKLSVEGKQNFIISFWSRRDPDISTEKNEFLIEHFNRLEYCESHIRGGINSDMGRIYILYGSPVEINRNFSSTNVNKPVQTWVYAINGVKEFIFVDRMEDGEYILVHSTHDDEINNPNWTNDFRY